MPTQIVAQVNTADNNFITISLSSVHKDRGVTTDEKIMSTRILNSMAKDNELPKIIELKTN
jgi:hypothetical protein